MPVTTEEQHKIIRHLQERLRPIAAKLDPPPIHWIGGGPDEGIDYCFDCAEIEVDALRQKNPRGNYFVDGGWDAEHESDGSVICYRCNRLLGYSLTRCGLSGEIEHYLDNQVGDDLSLTEAYEINAILDAAEYATDPQVIADAIRIGSTAAATIEKMESGHAMELSRWSDDGGAGERT